MQLFYSVACYSVFTIEPYKLNQTTKHTTPEARTYLMFIDKF